MGVILACDTGPYEANRAMALLSFLLCHILCTVDKF